MAATKTAENGSVTLTQAQLDELIQRTREEAIQAVMTMTAGSEPDPEPVKVLAPVDLSDADKVTRKYAKRLKEFWGTPPQPLGWATRRMRKRIAVFGHLTEEASERIFRGSLTRAQATAASYELEHGRAVSIDGIVIQPQPPKDRK